jgi:glycosyltransferase involved in cell wall biosynthesis
MAAYNAGPFIGPAIESLLAQTFRDFELVIVDDGSTDETPEIIRRYAGADLRIRAFRNDENRGLVFTRNRILQECRAPLVAIADADDIFLSTRLEKQWNYLQDHPEVGVLGSAVELTDCDGRKTGESRFYTQDRHIRFFLILGPCIWNTTSIYRRKLLVEVDGYRTRFDGGAEDYDLWRRLRSKTRFANLDEVLVRVRAHGASCTAKGGEALQNIYRVASDLMSEYFHLPIQVADGKALVLLLYHGATGPESTATALNLSVKLWRTGVRMETQDTIRLLRDKLSDALWIQAQYTIYSARFLSLRMALYALRLRPVLGIRTDFGGYCFRWATPDSLRCLIKRVSRLGKMQAEPGNGAKGG